jgi:hypothetical protein
MFLYFLSGNGSGRGKVRQENKFNIIGYREWNITTDNMSVMVGNQQLKMGTLICVTTSKI